MSETEQTIAATEQAAPEPTLEEIAAQVFGADAPTTEPEAKPVVEAPAAPEPPKPTPEEEKVAARVAAAKKAELRAAKDRAELAATRAEIEKAQADLAEAKRLAESVKAAKMSPSKALELLGLSPKDFLETLATENEPGSIAAREVAKEAEERQKLKSELDALKAQLTARDQQVEQARNEERRKNTEVAFVEKIEKNAAKYPHLVEEYTPDETVREGYRVLSEIVGYDDRGQPVTRREAFKAEHGEEPSDEDVADYLEHQAKQRAQIRQERRARMGQSATQPPSEGNPTGDLKTAQPDRGQSPRTLTSRAASEKATAPKPWSQEQADEESLRILSQALKAG